MIRLDRGEFVRWLYYRFISPPERDCERMFNREFRVLLLPLFLDWLSLSSCVLQRDHFLHPAETVRRHESLGTHESGGLQEEYRLIYRKLESTLYGPCK